MEKRDENAKGAVKKWGRNKKGKGREPANPEAVNR